MASQDMKWKIEMEDANGFDLGHIRKLDCL